jgi:hypothetical protein
MQEVFLIIDHGHVFKNYNEIVSVIGYPLQRVFLKDGSMIAYYSSDYTDTYKNTSSVLFVFYFDCNLNIIPFQGHTKFIETTEDIMYWMQDSLPKIIYK